MSDHTLTVYTRTLTRWHDPEEVFLALYADQDHAFWLDSSLVIPGVSRYSLMGDRSGPRSVSVSYDMRRDMLTIGRPGAEDE